jgi:hypothetical protein
MGMHINKAKNNQNNAMNYVKSLFQLQLIKDHGYFINPLYRNFSSEDYKNSYNKI